MKSNTSFMYEKTKLLVFILKRLLKEPSFVVMLAGVVIILTGTILASNTVLADDNTSVVDQINITVPVSCTMTGTGMDSHSTEIQNGLYKDNIGTTTLHAFCNDNEGFAIYAAGYTGNEVGGTNSNKLVGTTASSNAVIVSGIATTAGSPDISNWAMKLAISQDSGDTTSTNAFMIDSAPNVDLPSEAEQSATPAPFSEYHVVPNEYTKVAHKNSMTDMTATTGGVKLTTTYAAYISKTQPADTYSGQVKYALVHPSSHPTPIANPATLDTGRTVNSKLESLAATVVNGEETIITPEFDPTEDVDWEYYDAYIKSIDVHLKTATPAGFIPSEANTISASNSKKPIFIIFDNTNDAGIMNLYTEGDQIVLPADSSFMFYYFWMVSDLSFISDWDTSNVTDMRAMFTYTGSDADTFTMDLSDWDTSNVTDMSDLFACAGESATTWSIGDLSSWDTSNVTDMEYMFVNAGSSATTWSIGDLSSWNTSNVTNMDSMFAGAGSSATTWSIGDISSWNTRNVTNMLSMFSDAGYSATTFILDLSSWNTSNVTNMRDMLSDAGHSATAWSIGDLSSWNTSNVTNMYYMFAGAGSSATTWSIGDLSSWNTSNVTNMSFMFASAGKSATTFTLDLSSWNTSNVTDMYGMFSNAGKSATNFTLDLSSWNTSNVTYMISMFSNAGYSATTWSVTIPQTNGNSINNTTSRLYGQTTSKYADAPSGKSFTIAQP